MSTLLNLFNIWGLNTWYQNIATGAVVILVVVIDQLTKRNKL
jgi:ribose/xylose/arabinose/galactoside ABC-type transport system permease subunit